MQSFVYTDKRLNITVVWTTLETQMLENFQSWKPGTYSILMILFYIFLRAVDDKLKRKYA